MHLQRKNNLLKIFYAPLQQKLHARAIMFIIIQYKNLLHYRVNTSRPCNVLCIYFIFSFDVFIYFFFESLKKKVLEKQHPICD